MTSCEGYEEIIGTQGGGQGRPDEGNFKQQFTGRWGVSHGDLGGKIVPGLGSSRCKGLEVIEGDLVCPGTRGEASVTGAEKKKKKAVRLWEVWAP